MQQILGKLKYNSSIQSIEAYRLMLDEIDKKDLMKLAEKISNKSRIVEGVLSPKK